jgi:hypothetical protein
MLYGFCDESETFLETCHESSIKIISSVDPLDPPDPTALKLENNGFTNRLVLGRFVALQSRVKIAVPARLSM